MTTLDSESGTEPRPEGLLSWTLLRIHALAASLVVAEFLLMQVIAILITTALYWQAPLIDPDIKRDVNHWMRIFQITSPTMTLSGGVAIVLSSYVLTIPLREQARRERARANEAEARAAKAEQERDDAVQQRDEVAQQRNEAAQQRQEAERQRTEAEERAAATEAALASLQNDVAELKAMLAERPARRRRRSLR